MKLLYHQVRSKQQTAFSPNKLNSMKLPLFNRADEKKKLDQYKRLTLEK